MLARGTRNDAIPRQRAIIFSHSPDRMRSLEGELEHDMVLTVARSLASVVGALCDDPAPVPQILVIDLDLLAPVEILELHAIRHRGWCGAIIALGDVPDDLRRSLGIDRVFALPVPCDVLREAITRIPFDAQTTRIPVYPPPGRIT
ncbi:MAG: hypothetical protein KF773_22065 [Deltaproteobacteria bacterium]|nr:hypothetical protein [Deltaproteobacteria bacterium]